MYDKSKKTWSQRLKITKTEKSATTATASVTTTPTTLTPKTPTTEQQHPLLHYNQQQQQHLLSKANNATFINRSPQSRTSTTPTTPTTPLPRTIAAMHLPSATAKTLNEFHGNSGYDFSPSALSRSMKYAEPWIYGTVRGIPNGARPYPSYQPNGAALQHGYVMQHPAFFAHPVATSELAIVICSCPEYLNGTKRDMKKASICKKCKGSRLPLAPIGGTVRLRQSNTPLALKTRHSSGAATMRVVSSGKPARPTILDPTQDPYDLMRRSRLLSPEPSMPTKLVATPSSASSKSSDKARSRGKSESPSRGRSRTRPNLPQPLPTSKTKKLDLKSASHSGSNNTASFSDCWLVEEPQLLSSAYDSSTSSNLDTPTTSSARRSILRCNVNPYDLISSKSTNTSTSSPSSSSPTSASPTASNSSSSTPTTIMNPTETKAAKPAANMPNTPSPRANPKMAAKQQDFDVADAELYDEAPPFLTRSHSNSQSKSSQSSSAKASGNINHGRTKQQQPNKRDVKSATSENLADDDDDEASVHDDESANDAPTKNKRSNNNNKKSYTNVKAIAGQRISLGETSRTAKKSLIKQSEDGRIYESIIIAGDEEYEIEDVSEEDVSADDVVQMTVDVGVDNSKASNNEMRRNSAGNVPILPSRSRQDLEQQPKRPQRHNTRQKSESSDETNATNSATTTTEATNHKSQQQQMANSKQLPQAATAAAATAPAIKSILKRPTITATEQHDGNKTATSHNSEEPTTTSRQEAAAPNTATTRQGRRQQMRAAKKELIEHLNSSSNLSSITSSTSNNTTTTPATAATTTASATAPTATPTSTFYIPMPQARKKVQFMVEDRIIQPDDNVDNSDSDNNDNESNNKNVVIAAVNKADDNEEDDDDDVDDIEEDDEDEVEFDKASTTTKATTKSLNYEYYERKREQLKAMQQQQQQQNTTKQQKQQQQQIQQTQINTATAANPCGQPPAAGKCSNFAAASEASGFKSLSGLLELQQQQQQQQQFRDGDSDDNDDDAVDYDSNKVVTNMKMKTTKGETPTKATALETTTTTTTTTTKAATTNQQAAAAMATLEHESNHVSSTLSASDAHNKNGNRNSNNNNNKSNNNKHGSKNYGSNNNKKTTHIKAINKNERIADACSNKSADNNLLSHVATSTTSSSAAVTDTPTTTHQSRNSINNTTTITANYEVATLRQDIVKDADSIDEESKFLLQKLVENDDFEDDADDNRATVERNSKNGETTLEARKKSPTQPLSAFVGDETELPLSRNPIKRSHSERQPAYNKLTNGCNNSNANNANNTNDANKTSNNLTTAHNSNNNNITNNNAAIFNFKDTMALRMKNVRSDSRDLFASNSMATAMTLLSSVRPREPPPPPPPTIDSLTKAAEHCENTKVGTKDCSLPSSATTARRSSLSSLSLGCSSSIASEALSPPAGHEKHKKQDATARNAKLSTNGLENHNNERLQQQKLAKPQQQQPPPQVVIIAPAAPLAATADGIAQTQATMATVVNSSKNQSNYTDNNSASCQVINRPTGSTDNSSTENVEAPNGSSSACDVTKPTDDQLTMKSNNNNVGHTIPTSPRRNNLQNNNNYGLFVKTNFTSSSSSSSSSKTIMTTTQPERTVVRVAPFNKTTSEVHRLKISHTDNHLSPMVNSNGSNNNNIDYNYDNDYYWRHSPSSPAYGDLSDQELSPFQSQKKTSILINGDDCYSTMNLSHDASTPLYQSSVVVADYSTSAGGSLTPTAITSSQQQQHFTQFEGLRVSATTNNTVTINVSSPRRTPEEELIYQNNQINSFLSRQAGGVSAGTRLGVGAAIIPINGSNVAADMVSLHRSASSTSSASATSTTSTSSSGSNNAANTKRGRTLIKLDYDKEKQQQQSEPIMSVEFKSTSSTTNSTTETSPVSDATNDLFSHEAELVKILRNPVEAVRRNLVPHVCGKNEPRQAENQRNKKMSSNHIDTTPNSQELSIILSSDADMTTKNSLALPKTVERQSFIAKLLEDPTLNQVAEGLENETIVQLIENSLKRLKESRSTLDTRGTKDNDDMMRLIDLSLQKLKEERQQTTLASTTQSATHLAPPPKDDGDGNSSNRGSISSVTSFSSANNYEMFDFDTKSESDCYQSCSSEITSPGDDDANDTAAASKRSKFYQMLVDATLAEIELSTGMDDADIEHHYESIRQSGDPIYEEIGEMPPPLPLSAPPLNDADLDKKAARSMFEGASKYEILSYLVDAKQRGLVREEPAFDYPINCSNPIIIEEEAVDTLSDLGKRKQKGEQRDNSSSRASIMSDSSEDNQSTMSSLSPPPAHSFLGGANGLLYRSKGNTASDIERNDSGVGSETSKSSRSKYQHPLTGTTTNMLLHKNSPIHLCEDCDGPVETQISDSGVLFAPLVCRKCGKKRAERKEIITEIVETEEKYGRDLQIVLEEFCQPMLVAGLLTQEQLSAIFLNTEDLLENNQTLAERMRDALDIALEQGDDDLLTVNIGRIFLDFTQMLHAFESYCVRQAGASLLLANLEKEKELLRIFLKVSQMENTVLRRMNLNSFLMVPVQRVTKYPLLLARLYKVTPPHLEGRDLLKQAQEKIELHLNHINQEAKDVPTKLWRRISSSSPNRRASCEIDMINIKLRKMAIDVLEWNHDEVRFAMEGKLLFTQPTDSNWKKARTIKLTPVNALLVTNGKPSGNYKAEKVMSDKLNFPKHTGVREASLLLVKEKCGRYTLIREPLYLDRCVVCSEADWDDYFEVQEISSKDTFIFKAEDGVRTKQWYTQLQYHAQGMGAWRKRRNALANIMINGMLARS